MVVAFKAEDGITGKREFRIDDFGGEPSFGDAYNVGRVREAEEIEFVKFGEETAGVKIEDF